MSERDNDEALTIEALRDKCDELESMEMLCSECNLPMKDHDCPISAAPNLRQGLENARAERDRLQSTVAALERERDEWKKEASQLVSDSVKLTTGFNGELDELRASRDSLARKVEALEAALKAVVCSAHPNPKDHPAMWPAWEEARTALAALAEPKEKVLP